MLVTASSLSPEQMVTMYHRKGEGTGLEHKGEVLYLSKCKAEQLQVSTSTPPIPPARPAAPAGAWTASKPTMHWACRQAAWAPEAPRWH